MLFVFTTGCSVTNPFDKSIKIGVNVEQTGPYEVDGNYYLKGIELAVKKVNENGGINNQKIKLVIMDNKSNAQLAADNVKKLVQNKKVSAILGSNVTLTNIAAAEEADKQKVPLITGGTISTITHNNGQTRPFVYSTVFEDQVQCEALANFARKKLKKRNAFVLYKEGDFYGKEYTRLFKKAFEDVGGKVTVKVYKNNAELSYLPEKLKASGNDILFIPVQYGDAAHIISIIRQQSIMMPVIGPDSWDVNSIENAIGTINLDNLYFGSIAFLGKNSHRQQVFAKEYRQIYNADPEVNAALGYDNALYLLQGIVKVGNNKADSINKALENINFTGVTGEIKISAAHHNTRQVSILSFKDGRKFLYSLMYPLAK